jgi:hypothetical protein
MKKETKKAIICGIFILLLVSSVISIVISNFINVDAATGEETTAVLKLPKKLWDMFDKKARDDAVNKIADEAEKTNPPKDDGKKLWACTHMHTPIGWGVCYGIWGLSIARGIELGWDISRGKGTCAVEKPYPDMVAARCRSCNEDPYRICTQERCTILGKCIALKKENFSSPNIGGFDAAKDINYECIPGDCKNYGLVAFKVINATWSLSDGTMLPGYTGQVEYRTAPSNLTLNLNEIEYNTKVMNITVTTDQLAKCRYIIDKAGAKFEEMTNFDNNDYPNDGTEEMKPIPQSALILFPGDLTRDENHTIFIKCSNICPDKGGIHNQYYDHNQVKFKFKPKPDSLWPAITFLDPQNNAVISNEWPRLNVSIWLDENGVCYYATKNRNWNITLSNMTKMGEGRIWKDDPYYTTEDTPIIKTRCIQDENCTDLRKDICTHCFMELDMKKGFDEINWSVLPQDYQDQLDQMGLYNTTKMFRISLRCQDKTGNTMPEEESLNYIIMTMPPYNITIITPENDSKTYNNRPEIQVTSGARNTQCKYLTSTKTNLIPQWDKMTFIDEETSTTHSGIHNETLEGGNYPGKAYTIYALCRDEWNMESRATAHFSVIADTKAPIMIRTYHDAVGGSFLILETDEISTCAYTYDKCGFNFSQGALMIGENQTIHSAYWSEKTLFIKCQDEYGNFLTSQGSTKDPTYPWCTAMLRPFEIPSTSA